MSFYRKYRPQNFDSLVGQDHIRETLMNALKLDRVSHAYLFAGSRGTGKTSSARILAKAVNCTNLKDATPCEQCDICNDINEGRLIDVIEIDAASNRGIDEMRDLKEKINFAPTRAKNKVYIIDEVHMLTKEAFNALLKTLEEPPAHTFFILATTEVHKIPETILSRCQRFDFKRISDAVIAERLKFIADSEKIEAEQQALEVIAHVARGGMRDAIGLLEQLTQDNHLTYDHVSSALGLSGFASLEKLFGLLMQKDAQGGLAEIHNLYMEGHDLTQFNKSFLEFLRGKLLKSVEEGKRSETEQFLKFIDLFQEAYDAARFAVIPQLPLEMAVIESCMEAKVVPAQSVASPQKTENIAPPTKAEPVTSPQEEPSQRSHQGIGKGVFSFDDVKAAWSKIPAQIKSPVVKRSFLEAVLDSVQDNTVAISFPSQFHFDKVMETVNRVELENVFSEILGGQVKIVAEVSRPAPKIASEEEKLAAQAAEIFEGEMV
jgi:DNA polymerase III subunit gamma/tau